MNARRTFLLVVCIVISSALRAQWQKTNGPLGGSTQKIEKVGDYLFLNGEAGGIFRSQDGGLTWTAVNNGLPSYPHCFAFTSYGTKIYAAINADGVFYSSDFGEHWISISNGLQSSAIYSLLVNGEDIYAGKDIGGVYYSTNHGNTWVFRQGPFQNMQVKELAMNGTKVLAAATGTNAGIYYSVDKGVNWTEIIVPAVTSINAFAVADNAMYVTGGHGMLISRDNGVTWNGGGIGTSGPGLYFMAAIYASGDQVYVGASSGVIFSSANEGQTWTEKASPVIDNFHRQIFSDNGKLFLSTDMGVYYSADQGTSWEARNNGLANEIVRWIKVNDSTLYVSTNTGLHISSDNGATWGKKIIGPTFLGKTTVGGLYFGSGYTIAGVRDGIYRSTDGITWIPKVTIDVNKGIQGIGGKAGKIVAISGDGMYVSPDNGENWTFKTNALFTNQSFVSVYVKGDSIVLGGIGDLWISKDFGTSWTSNKVQSAYFFPHAIHYQNGKLIVSTYQGIFKSSDFGTTWSKATGDLPAFSPANDLFINKDGYYYLATTRGVYVSYNEGTNWHAVNEGMENTNTFALAVTNEYMFCGTYGMSVWKNALDKVNVRPNITGVKNEFEITNEESLILSINDLSITDPDDTYPGDFALLVEAGANYTFLGTVITPAEDFVGALEVKAKVHDGHNFSEVFLVPVTVNQVVAVGEGPDQFMVYPNPSSGKFYIKGSGHPSDVSVYDPIGRTIMQRNFPGTTDDMLMDLSDHKNGLYLVRVRSRAEIRTIRISKK